MQLRKCNEKKTKYFKGGLFAALEELLEQVCGIIRYETLDITACNWLLTHINVAMPNLFNMSHLSHLTQKLCTLLS